MYNNSIQTHVTVNRINTDFTVQYNNVVLSMFRSKFEDKTTKEAKSYHERLKGVPRGWNLEFDIIRLAIQEERKHCS